MPSREVAGAGAVAVELSLDHRQVAAVLAAQEPGGKVVVRSHMTNTLEEMRAWLTTLAAERTGITILHHETVPLGRIPHAQHENVKRSHSFTGFSLTRQAIDDVLISHDGDASLAEQVLGAATWKSGADGHIMLSQHASDVPITAARCMCWAVGHLLHPSRHRRPLIAAA